MKGYIYIFVAAANLATDKLAADKLVTLTPLEMKFYNREKELEALQKMREAAFSEHSKLTVLTGRRRIGKTSLIFKSCEGTPTVYLFVKRSNEADLCAKFTEIITQALNVLIPGKISDFANLFEFIMDLGTRMKFNLVIDEFQEFYNINPSVYSRRLRSNHQKATHSIERGNAEHAL